MRRRTLLQLGIGSAVALAAIGGGIALLLPALDGDGRLTASGRAVMRGVARAVLDGVLPVDPGARDSALAAHLRRLDDTLGAFPSATRGELSQLLSLLATAPGRLALAGLRPSWDMADVAAMQQALQDMRSSTLSVRQQAYHALRDLTNAAWFADPGAWPALGYDGPVTV